MFVGYNDNAALNIWDLFHEAFLSLHLNLRDFVLKAGWCVEPSMGTCT